MPEEKLPRDELSEIFARSLVENGIAALEENFAELVLEVSIKKGFGRRELSVYDIGSDVYMAVFKSYMGDHIEDPSDIEYIRVFFLNREQFDKFRRSIVDKIQETAKENDWFNIVKKTIQREGKK